MTTDADDKYKGYDIIAVDTSQERLIERCRDTE